MKSITNIKCTACGAPLKVHKNESMLMCKYCGSEYVTVQKNNGVELQLSQISPSLDRAASELAIKRLREELAELDTQSQRILDNLEIKQKQAISEIENRNNISLSTPTIEKLKNELKLLGQEQDLALTKGKSRLGLITVRNTGIGLGGGCATFLVSFIAVFICSADIAGLLRSTTNIDLSGGQVVPYLLLCSTIMALVFLVGFTIFASRRQKKLSQELSSRQRQLEEAIDEQQRSIAIETTKHISLINDQMVNQKLAVEKEIEAAKESIKKEISDRQEQLQKHYNRVKI
jgi:DNA-directed RNA polymerase subunit RPC12/RpoP